MERSARRDGVAFAVLAAVLFAWFAAPGIARGFVFPVGPDAPVYLWWTRLVGVEGLSAVTRPGVPALVLVLAGVTGATVVAVLAALEIAGGVLTGVAAAALVRVARPEDRATWVLAGVLTGTFAVHVATGYLATLVFGVLFLAAAAALAIGGRRGTVAAALLLGTGAIAHPRFLAVGAAVLLLAAVLAVREDRGEARRLVAAVLGGTAVLGAAGLALLVGPSPLLADTSRDAFLRRVGLDDVLHRAYLTRFLARWTRYAPWGSLPLLALAVARPRSTVDRILLAWVAVAAGGAAFSVVTGLLPVDRFITFAFAVPMLAAIGAVRLARAGTVPAIGGRVAAVLLVATMLVGAASGWLRQEPFLDGRDLAALRVANAVAEAAPDTALVVPVGAESSAFLLTLSGNAVRAAVPPDRIRDVVMTVIGSAPGAEGEAIGARTALDEAEAVASHGGRAQRILLVPFAERVARGAPWVGIAADVAIDPVPPSVATGARDGATVALPEPRDAVGPFAPALPSVLALAVLALVTAIGWAWTGPAGFRGGTTVLAFAPAVGIGATVLVGFVLERLGVPIGTTVGALAVSGVALGGGLLARRLADRSTGVPVDRSTRP